MLCALCDLCVQRDSFTSSKAVGLRGCRFGFARHPQLAANPFLNRLIDVGVLLRDLVGARAPLAEPFAAVREPRARLFDDAFDDGQIEQVTGPRDAFAVHDVELGFAEGRRDLVLHDLDAGAPADHRVAVLDARSSAVVLPHRRVELHRAAAGRRFGIPEHDADLLAQLFDEDEARLRLRDRAGELAERLRHEARLQTHLRVAHLAFDFRLRHQRRDRVDDDHVDAVRSNEDLDDLQRLFAVVGLRDEQIVDVDAQFLRVRRIERVLRVDERRHAAEFLSLRDDLQRERRFPRRLRSEDFGDAAARHTANAEREVDADSAGRNGVDRLDGAFLTEAHDRALAELLFDLADGQIHGLEFFPVLSFVAFDWRHADSFRWNGLKPVPYRKSGKAGGPFPTGHPVGAGLQAGPVEARPF